MGTPIPLGLNEPADPVEAFHLLVVGHTGTGKTLVLRDTFVRAIVSGWDVRTVETGCTWAETANVLGGVLRSALDRIERVTSDARPILLVLDDATWLRSTPRRRDVVSLLSAIMSLSEQADVHLLVAIERVSVRDLAGLPKRWAKPFARLLLGPATVGDWVGVLRTGIDYWVDVPVGSGIFEPTEGAPCTVQLPTGKAFAQAI